MKVRLTDRGYQNERFYRYLVQIQKYYFLWKIVYCTDNLTNAIAAYNEIECNKVLYQKIV